MANNNNPKESFHLHLTTKEDCLALFPVFNNTSNIKYTNFKHVESLETLQLFLERFLALNKNEPLQYGPYSIILKNTLVGLCGLQQKNIQDGSTELWYIIDQQYWGKGIAKKAIELLIATCKKNAAIKIIYAEAVANNIASWKILEQLGFIRFKEIKNGFSNNFLQEDLFCYTNKTFK